MTVKINVVHFDLNKLELIALLWDGITLAADNGDEDASYTVKNIPRGFSGPAYTQIQIRDFVRSALEKNGRRSVECGTDSETFNDAAEAWCSTQITRTYKV